MWLQVQTVTSIPAQQLEDSLATGRILPEGSLINMLFLSCCSSDCLYTQLATALGTDRASYSIGCHFDMAQIHFQRLAYFKM